MKKLLRWLGVIEMLIVTQVALASSTFKVESIKVEGLNRIHYGTVLNYLPIQTGQEIEPDDSSSIIKALYKTGFFDNVRVKRRGNTLIIYVKERPTIGKVEITGKTSVSKKTLLESFKGVGLGQGEVFNRSILDSIRESMQNRLYERGNYGAKVTADVTSMSDNRVAVNLHVSEGGVAVIKEIKIVGNKAFYSWVLSNQMTLTSGRPWSLVTKQDEYSREKLDADLERLQTFYLDKGYLDFKIDSVQVSMTPSRRRVYITVRITEGAQYRISGFDVMGQTILPRDDIMRQIELEKGAIFSRRDVADATRKMGDYLADYGYAFAMIRPIPEVDEEKHTVFVNFNIEPGKKFYVRQINFSGNIKTEDLVLRREMRQEEGAVESLANIRLSERRLNRLGYFKEVQLKTTRVAGIDDQIDLEFQVKEAASARFNAGAGYSVTQGLMLNAGFNQTNFLGTGKSIGFNAKSTQYSKSLTFDYFNPYFTEEGLGRGFSVYANLSNFDKHADVSDYIMDQYGANMNFVLPITEDNTVTYGVGYQRTDLHIGSHASDNLKLFEDKHGEDFHNAIFSAGWTYNTMDRAHFPTEGYVTSLGGMLAAPLSHASQSYYKVGFSGRYLKPIYKGYILSLRSEIDYGDGILKSDDMPFYENFYAGGIGVQGAVRGYRGLSIGPKDSKGDAFGGNFLVGGTAAIIVPQPFLQDTLRTSLFVDAGNVYTNQKLFSSPFYQCSGVDSGPIRTSAGIAFEWFSPMGPIVISLAKPLNIQDCDKSNVFQFTFGTGV